LTVVDNGAIRPFILTTDPVCAGTTSGAIDIPNIRNITSPYTIQMGDRQSTSLVRFVELGAGDYEIFMEDAIGCTFDTVVNLVDPEPFIIDLGEDVVLDLGQSISINPVANFTISQYDWSSLQTEDCGDDCLNQTFVPTTSGTYTLTATSDLGCRATDSIEITVNPVRKLYVPNVFSPNADGQNDFFALYPAVPNVERITEVAIYDRWGNLVWSKDTIDLTQRQQLWDGQYRGQLVERGAYLYTAKVLFLDGVEEVVAGTVSVIY